MVMKQPGVRRAAGAGGRRGAKRPARQAQGQAGFKKLQGPVTPKPQSLGRGTGTGPAPSPSGPANFAPRRPGGLI